MNLNAILHLVVIAFMTAASAAAQVEQPLIPRKVLFGNPRKASPKLSPDGKKLSWVEPKDNVLNVWVKTLGGEDDQVVTTDTKRGVRNYFWQGDSAHILYLQDRDGDENWHLYQTSIADRRTTDLTPFEGARVAEGMIYDINHPTELLAGLNVRDKKLFDMYRINLETGDVVLDTTNPGNVAGWDADNDLVIRAMQIHEADGSHLIRVRENTKAEWKDAFKWGHEETFGGILAFTGDNQSVYFRSSVGANAARLLRVNLQTSESKVIAEDPEYDNEGIMTNPRTYELEGYRFIRARREWTLLDPKVKADFEVLSKVREGDFDITSRDSEDRQWIVTYLADDGPAWYYLYDRDTRKATPLFSNRPEMEKYKLPKMQPVSFPSRDGLTLHGYLTLPLGKKPEQLPMVLFVHGGPWGRDVWGPNTDVQWLADRGYGVLQINFRGSTGYGKKFLAAGDREWGAAMHNDLIDAKRWAVAKGYCRTDQMAIYGGSYGGYAVFAGLAFTPEEFACGVSVVGVSNIITLIQTIPPYWEPIKALFTKRVGDITKDEVMLKSRSPLFKADKIVRPLLIAHGANDPRVKQAEADQIVEAMRKNGQPVEYLLFPDEGHGFVRPENRLKFYAAAEAFLAKHLGGRAEPHAPDEDATAVRK